MAEEACEEEDLAARVSSIRANQSENSSSPGAEAVEDTDTSRRSDGRPPRFVRGLLKRGEELRAGSLPAAMEEAAEEEYDEEAEWEKRGRRLLVWLYWLSSEEESRDDSERFGPGEKEIASAGAGTGSWKRTVRFGLGFVEVEVDVWIEERPVEWMEDWSVLA